MRPLLCHGHSSLTSGQRASCSAPFAVPPPPPGGVGLPPLPTPARRRQERALSAPGSSQTATSLQGEQKPFALYPNRRCVCTASAYRTSHVHVTLPLRLTSARKREDAGASPSSPSSSYILAVIRRKRRRETA